MFEDIRGIFTATDTIGFLNYFGIPTLFLMSCMSVVGWIAYKRRSRLIQRGVRWIAVWALAGFFVASLLAVAARMMNTDFVYNNASLVWPFCLTLDALGGHSLWVQVFLSSL